VISDVSGYPGLGLVKAGAGTLELSATNTFVADVTVAEGVLEAAVIGDRGVSGNLGAGSTVILGSDGKNGTLRVSVGGPQNNDRNFQLAAGGSGTVEVSRFMDIEGVISGDGDFHKRGANEAGNSGTRLSLEGVNTYAGDTYIDEGVLQVSAGGTIPDSSDVHITGGAADGRLRLNKAEAINGLYGDGKVQTHAGSAQTLTIGAAGGDGNFSGVIEPGISLVKTGEGTQILRGLSTFTGDVTIAQGSLDVIDIGAQGDPGNLGAGNTIILGSDGHNGTLKADTAAARSVNRNIVLAAGGSGTIENSDYMDISGVISGEGDLIKKGLNAGAHNGGSRLSLSGANTYTGDTYIVEGVIQAAASGTLPDTTNVHISGGAGNGRLRLVYHDQAINGLFGDGIVQSYLAQARQLTIGAAGGDGDFSGVIEPGISLVKTGEGTQILSGENTYAGGTVIDEGALLINNTAGSGTGTGDVIVNQNGMLGGSGSVSGAVTLGGAISPGASVGSIASGTQTWQDGGSFVLEIDDAAGDAGATPGWDLLEIDGTLELGDLSPGGFEIDLVSLLPGGGTNPGDAANFSAEGLSEYAWPFVQTTQGINGFDAELFTIDISGFSNPTSNFFGPGRFDVASSGADNRNLVLTFTAAVPEPSSAALALLGLLVLGLAAGRRRR
jgi:MYXO-CTERM domain-containing protein